MVHCCRLHLQSGWRTRTRDARTRPDHGPMHGPVCEPRYEPKHGPKLEIGEVISKWNGELPTGKSVSVSFRVRVVRACERARRSCVGEWRYASSTLEVQMLRCAAATAASPAALWPRQLELAVSRVLSKMLRSGLDPPRALMKVLQFKLPSPGF